LSVRERITIKEDYRRGNPPGGCANTLPGPCERQLGERGECKKEERESSKASAKDGGGGGQKTAILMKRSLCEEYEITHSWKKISETKENSRRKQNEKQQENPPISPRQSRKK